MNISVSFHIQISTRKRGRFRMEVEHFYSSDQVERFKIHGKNRFIIMEKRLAVKRQPWKITEGQFNTSDIQEASMAIRDMQDSIDEYLKKRNGEPGGSAAYRNN